MPGLRLKFLLAILAGGLAPMGLLGLWLTRTAERSGEELLRAQLEGSLEELATEAEKRWFFRRGDLLLLAENEAVRDGLRDRVASQDEHLLEYLGVAFQEMHQFIELVSYRDAVGEVVWTLRQDAAQVPRAQFGAAPDFRSASPALTVHLDIPGARGEGRLGVLEARVRLEALLPLGAERAGPAGSRMSVIDRSSGEILIPVPFEAEQLAAERFEHEGQRWIAVRRPLGGPPADLVLAAALDPYTQPFERAARRGALALLGVALAGFLGALFVSGRLTGSLERLAVAADAVSRGDLEQRLEIGAEDEVGRVARAFNHMSESLRRTLAELSQRQALAAVGEFASSLAHEIRNPLTSIRIDLQRVQEKLAHDARLQVVVGRALSAVQRLDRTVTGALRVARSGQVKPDAVDLRNILETASHAAAPEFAARGARLEPPRMDTGPEGLRGDPAALEQLFLNLLLNAAQALDPGGRAGVLMHREDGWVDVSVWDTGKGIAEDALARVFEPFYTTRSEGTGLGLAVAQRIAVAHGGEIRIESTPGRGTTVHVRLPAGAGPLRPD